MARLQPFSASGLLSQEKGAGESAGTAQLERAEVLVPIVVRYVRIFGLPLSESEEILSRNPTFSGSVPEMGPLLAREALPLYLWHGSAASAAQNQ